jgi:hypothetical protein
MPSLLRLRSLPLLLGMVLLLLLLLLSGSSRGTCWTLHQSAATALPPTAQSAMALPAVIAARSAVALDTVITFLPLHFTCTCRQGERQQVVGQGK